MSGTWGFGRWGSAVWGWAQSGAILRGTIVSEELIRSLTQTTRTPMQISFQVLLDGIDQSAMATGVDPKNYGLSSISSAEVVFACSEVPGLVMRQTLIEVKASIIAGAVSFESCIFKGKAYSQKDTSSGKTKSVTVTFKDLSSNLDEATPKNVIFTGKAIDLISQELNELGFPVIDSTFQDYTLTSFNCQQYKTVRDLINTVANGRNKTYCFLDVDGIFKIYDAGRIQKLIWSLPLSAQTNQQKLDTSKSKYNQVIASNGAGLSYPYNNTDFQDAQGILKKEVVAPLCLTLSDLANYAAGYAAESQAEEWEIETPLIPFIKIGEEVGFMGIDGIGKTIRVEEINRYLSWPSGCWQKIRGKAFPLTPEKVLFLQDIPIIFDNTAQAWRGRTTVSDFLSSGVSLPQFTLAQATKIHYIATLHESPGATPGTVIIRDADTLDEFGPFAMTSATRWGTNAFFNWYSEDGIELPAGTYEISDSEESTWGVITDYVYGGTAGNLVLGSPIAQARGVPA